MLIKQNNFMRRDVFCRKINTYFWSGASTETYSFINSYLNKNSEISEIKLIEYMLFNFFSNSLTSLNFYWSWKISFGFKMCNLMKKYEWPRWSTTIFYEIVPIFPSVLLRHKANSKYSGMNVMLKLWEIVKEMVQLFLKEVSLNFN